MQTGNGIGSGRIQRGDDYVQKPKYEENHMLAIQKHLFCYKYGEGVKEF